MLIERSHTIELSSSKSHTKDGKEWREKRIAPDKRIRYHLYDKQYSRGGWGVEGEFQADDMNTYMCSFNTDSSLLVLTFHKYTEPSAEPTEMYWLSGLKAARDQSQPTLKPSALQKNKRQRETFY
jgi:hypothetical protein